MNTKYSNNVTTFAYSFSTNLLYASNMRTNYRKDTACSLPMQTYGFNESGGQGSATFFVGIILAHFWAKRTKHYPKKVLLHEMFLAFTKISYICTRIETS